MSIKEIRTLFVMSIPEPSKNTNGSLEVSREENGIDALSLGGFPIEIKTKVRYHIICCYHIFT